MLSNLYRIDKFHSVVGWTWIIITTIFTISHGFDDSVGWVRMRRKGNECDGNRVAIELFMANNSKTIKMACAHISESKPRHRTNWFAFHRHQCLCVPLFYSYFFFCLSFSGQHRSMRWKHLRRQTNSFLFIICREYDWQTIQMYMALTKC